MKKIFIVLLLVFVVGCAKKLPPPQTAPKEPAAEAVAPESKAAKEAVKESVEQKEAKLHDEAKLREEAKQREAAEAAGSVLKDVHFDFDKYNIREDARPTLDTIAAHLKKNEAMNIVVEGHCDDRGTNEYNLALGERRAKSAKDYLSSLGVQSSRMSVVTYGEEKPLCTEQNETCWQQNRRAHFVAQ